MDAFHLLVAMIFWILSAAFLRLSLMVYGDMFAPVGLYSGVTFFSLGLWHLRLVPLVGISKLVYLVVLLSVLCVFLGSVMACWSCWKNIPRRRKKTIYRIQDDGLHVFFWLIIMLGTFGWTYLLLQFAADHGISTVWKDSYMLQTSFQRQYFGYLNVTGIMALPAFVLLRQAKLARWWHLVALSSPLIGLVLAGIKAYLIFSLVTALLAHSAAGERNASFLKITLLAVVGLAFFVVYDRIIDIYVSTYASSSGSSFLDEFNRPYVYLTGGWSAISVVIEEGISEQHWGYFSLSWLWKVLGLGLISPVAKNSSYIEIGEESGVTTNVYTFAGSLYWDFGIIGVVFGSIGWGFLSSRLYIIAKSGRSWEWLLLAALINYGMFLSFMTYFYAFNMLYLFVTTVFLSGISRLLSRIKVEDNYSPPLYPQPPASPLPDE